jgi:hypothetical protein
MIIIWLIYFTYYYTIAKVFRFLNFLKKNKEKYTIYNNYIIRHIDDINIVSYIKDNEKINTILKNNNPMSVNCFVNEFEDVQSELSTLCTFFIDPSSKVIRGFKTEWIKSWPSDQTVVISFITENDSIKTIAIDNKNKNDIIYIP